MFCPEQVTAKKATKKQINFCSIKIGAKDTQKKRNSEFTSYLIDIENRKLITTFTPWKV